MNKTDKENITKIVITMDKMVKAMILVAKAIGDLDKRLAKIERKCHLVKKR